MKRKIIALLAAAALLLCVLPSGILAAGEEIEIHTAEELAELSDKCRLDSWSRGKKIVLRADIDLAGSDFEPIPSFGGTFEGNGHTVSGLELTEVGSAVGGLFRYVQEGGTVREALANICGAGGAFAFITPDGTLRIRSVNTAGKAPVRIGPDQTLRLSHDERAFSFRHLLVQPDGNLSGSFCHGLRHASQPGRSGPADDRNPGRQYLPRVGHGRRERGG